MGHGRRLALGARFDQPHAIGLQGFTDDAQALAERAGHSSPTGAEKEARDLRHQFFEAQPLLQPRYRRPPFVQQRRNAHQRDGHHHEVHLERHHPLDWRQEREGAGALKRGLTGHR